MYDLIRKIPFRKLINHIIQKVKDTVCTIYNTIKNEVVNLLDGTTFKKIFNAGYRFFVGSDMDESTRKVNERIDNLVKAVEKLKKTIEESKLFVQTLMKEIKKEGKFNIFYKIYKHYQNYKHKNRGPAGDTKINIFKRNIYKILNPDDIKKNIDIIKIEKNLKKMEGFKTKTQTNKNIVKSNYEPLVNIQNHWTVFNKTKSYEETEQTTHSVKDAYDALEIPDNLNEYFMIDFNSAVYFIDGHLISSSNKKDMLKSFKKLVTNEIEQKIIAAYANPTLLKPSYLKLIAEHPELDEKQIIRTKNFYEITHLEDGTIKIIATNLSDFYSIDANDVQNRHTYGVKTSVIFSYRKAPVIEYSYFVR